MSDYTARGVLHIHSAPAALCPHIEWAVSSVVDARVDFDWTLSLHPLGPTGQS